MSLNFTVSTEIPSTAEAIYNAWLDSETHAEMTAADSAVASREVGAEHRAHGTYIWGKNLELIPNKKIVQSWRTAQFKEEEEDSVIEVTFEENDGSTLVTLKHSGVPDSETHIEQGWIDYYFEPMKAYFNSSNS